MADFKKSGVKRFYEKSGGFNRHEAGRPAFAQKKWDGPSRPVTMHKATCAKCGNSCEVPFRPFDNRLIYCNDCFQGKRGGDSDRSYNKFPQKNYTGRNDAGNGNDGSVKDQLEMLNEKIDRLTKAIEKMANIEISLPDVEIDETGKTNPVAKDKKVGKKVFKNYKRPF